MVDMAKLKEDALQRKRQHEEKELRKQVSSSKRPARKAPASRNSAAKGRTRGSSSQRALATKRPQTKKRKRSISRWVLDILLFLGALIVVIIMFSPF